MKALEIIQLNEVKKMGYVKCEKCDLNCRKEDEEYCGECQVSVGGINSPVTQSIYTGYFFVFQGDSCDSEMADNYIKAPINHKTDGKTIHHWARMNEVKKGDFILHGHKGFIVAISVAKDKAYRWKYSDKYQQEMNRIDLKTCKLFTPIGYKSSVKNC